MALRLTKLVILALRVNFLSSGYSDVLLHTWQREHDIRLQPPFFSTGTLHLGHGRDMYYCVIKKHGMGWKGIWREGGLISHCKKFAARKFFILYRIFCVLRSFQNTSAFRPKLDPTTQ